MFTSSYVNTAINQSAFRIINCYIIKFNKKRCAVSIGNSMVSSAIWEKHARVSFSKTYKIARVRRTSSICVFEKLMSACFSQISRETILLLDNNLYIEMIETR